MDTAQVTFRETGNIYDAINRMLRPKLEAAGRDEVEAIKADISTPCPVYHGGTGGHSPDHGPPYLETGKLQASIAYRIVPGETPLDELEFRAQRTNSSGDPKVAIYLEKGTRRMADRPFMSRAMARVVAKGSSQFT